ncbi:MAG: HAD-IA family hydrolase [Acidobacteriota bacterium]|nr:HAD-IA family hydrolase [Acidobacteriota bacterium]
MIRTTEITTLFLDVGGVLLTNGWDHLARQNTARHFGLDYSEMEERHKLTFEVHEEDRLTFDEYLDLVIFWKKRAFTPAQLKQFMFEQSQPYPEMIELFSQLKVEHGLKIVVVSNESRGVNAYRIKTFKLDALVDSFISSCFVHVRKPDVQIFRLALDTSQTLPQHVLFVDNTPMFVQIAEGLGIRSVLHTDYNSTCTKLASLGLGSDLRSPHGID